MVNVFKISHISIETKRKSEVRVRCGNWNNGDY